MLSPTLAYSDLSFDAGYRFLGGGGGVEIPVAV